MGAGGGVSAGDGDLAARVAVPGGDAMAPPQLTADAPVVYVLHPVEKGLLVLLGSEADGFLAVGPGLHGGDGFVRQRLNLDEPLRGKARLDHSFAAVAVADVVGVVLDAG